MIRHPHLLNFHPLPASLHAQAASPANRLEQLLPQTVQPITIHWHDHLILLAALAALLLLIIAAILLFRKIRNPRNATLRRSPWPHGSKKNQPDPTPLRATGTFRQRRRRRARQPH